MPKIKEYKFKYAKDYASLMLDEEQIICDLKSNEVKAIDNIKEAVYSSFDEPVEEKKLCDWAKTGDKICLVVSDMSRFWMRQDLVVPHVVSYLNEKCGVHDDDIVIVIANGTHEGGDEKELQTLVTKEIFDRIKTLNHDCTADDLVYIGTTTRGTDVKIHPEVVSRKVICIGAATHHVMAGYGGGRKSILPGVAALESIKQNHAHSLHPLEERSNPLIGNGVLANNPLNEDMLEAVKMVSDVYMLNLVMNADMKLAYLFAGHYEKSWLKACKAVSECYEVEISEQADVLITSSGGYPKDMSFYQGTKTIDNVEGGLKIGGTLIIFMQCIDGGGPAEYFDWLKPLKEGTLDETLRENFTIPGYVFYLNCEQAQRYNIILVSELDENDAAAMGIKVYKDANELQKELDITGKTVRIVKNGSTTIPRIKA